MANKDAFFVVGAVAAGFLGYAAARVDNRDLLVDRDGQTKFLVKRLVNSLSLQQKLQLRELLTTEQQDIIKKLSEIG